MTEPTCPSCGDLLHHSVRPSAYSRHEPREGDVYACEYCALTWTRRDLRPAGRVVHNNQPIEHAAAIRTANKNGSSYTKVAHAFGVSKSLVAQICRNELWNS